MSKRSNKKQIWITPQEIAEELRVSTMTISRWPLTIPGFPKPIKIGQTIRFKADELEAFLESKRKTADIPQEI